MDPSTPPPAVPAPLPIGTALARSAPLAQLAARLQDSHARLAALQPHLPAGLREHVRAGPVDDAGWSVLAANNAVASKLRQLQPRLEAALVAAGWGPCAIRIRVAWR